MTSQFLGSAYLALSAFVILALAQLSQKPLCINSQVIEKLTMTDETQVYRCAVRKKVPFSTEFVQNELLINHKIIAFENWLSHHWGIKKVPRVTVKIVKNPLVTQLQGKTILIWEQNLKSTKQLETEIAKAVLRSFNHNFFSSNELALNSLADFTIKIWSENKMKGFGGFPAYVAHQWWLAFSEMKTKGQYLLFKNIPTLIKSASAKSFKDEETRIYDQLIQTNQLFSKESVFYSLLKSRGNFEAESLVAAFDYLVLMPQVRPEIFKSLASVQLKNSNMSLGVWDGKYLYHVGSKSQLSASSFNKLKIRHLIWESCDDLEIKDLLNVSAEVRKLLVVRSCSLQNQPDYSTYIRKSIAGFAASHPQVSFVQLDMPSLNMRKNDSILQEKIFRLMAQQSANRHVKNSFFTLYGLEQLYWDQKLQIFVPKSHIDAVESFRILKAN